jgi:hypothetical protein
MTSSTVFGWLNEWLLHPCQTPSTLYRAPCGIQALAKARVSLVDKMAEVAEHGAVANEAVVSSARLTFKYLLMQLHCRGDQEFWRVTVVDDVCAYLSFCVIDIYADVLTHLEGDFEADLEAVQPAPLLEMLVWTEMGKWATMCSGLHAQIMLQRSSHNHLWFPSEASLIGENHQI